MPKAEVDTDASTGPAHQRHLTVEQEQAETRQAWQAESDRSAALARLRAWYKPEASISVMILHYERQPSRKSTRQTEPASRQRFDVWRPDGYEPTDTK